MIRWTIRYRTLAEFGSNTLFGHLPPHEFCLRWRSRFESRLRQRSGGPATSDVVLKDGHFLEAVVMLRPPLYWHHKIVVILEEGEYRYVGVVVKRRERAGFESSWLAMYRLGFLVVSTCAKRLDV